MKKLIIMAMLAIGTTAFAEDYKYLTMAYNSVEQSIELATVQKITFEGGQVVVATSEGNQTFPQSQMEKMFFSQTPTAVKSVTAEANEAEKAIYDLTGRRVQKATKGIYIIDGKKVVIK